MKKYLALIAGMLALSFAVVSQAPQKLNYQAIVRNAVGQPVADSTPVLVRFTLHDSVPGGTVVYTEIQSTFANAFGLITLMIGNNVSLATVNWASGAKYLQVEANVNNAGFFTDMGTTQLMSVPYALFAANSANGPPGATGPTGATGIAGPTGATGATSIAGQQVHKRYDAVGFTADCDVQSCSEYFPADTSWAIPDTGNFYVSLSPGTWAVTASVKVKRFGYGGSIKWGIRDMGNGLMVLTTENVGGAAGEIQTLTTIITVSNITNYSIAVWRNYTGGSIPGIGIFTSTLFALKLD